MAILCGLLYYCWKLGQPRPTYYETAIKINEKRDNYRRSKGESHPRHPYRQTTPKRWPGHTSIIDEVTSPKAVKIHWDHEMGSIDNLVEAAWKEPV
ncbi:hypothetical protein HD806DRAFT_476018 [Xylariaceae sp. AK1471]|nr:hypothetical protein HD806DRAFT_476018 [Xylariaceae sp. AK1471]